MFYDKITLGEFETFLTKAFSAEKTKLKESIMKNTKTYTLFLTRGALIAAMYVALTYLCSVVGLSSGVIQFRISEVLCILPIFMPDAILGLTVGCLLSNLIASGGMPMDIFVGALATLIGALGAYLLRMLPKKLLWLATLPTVISNALIIPLVLILEYGAKEGYFFLMATVGIGELICAGIGGTVLLYALKRARIFTEAS